MNRELLRRKFDEMMAEYRTTPNLDGHTIVSINWPIITVRSGDSGNEYTVNARELSCNCQGYRNWRRCKHLLFVIKEILEGNIEIPESEEQQILYDISDYIRSYRGGATGNSRTISIPIEGIRTFGVEVEIKFQNYTTMLGAPDLELLFNSGTVVERDGSVDLEFKSPILAKSGIAKFALNPFWQRIESLQDKNYQKQGIHIHIGWDFLFDAGKRPNRKTINFLNKAGEKLEKMFNFKKVFGRRPNNYCQLISENPDPYSRYRWLNLTTLRRPVGKTLEIRGFFSKPTRLLRYIFTANYLSLYLERALIKWRALGRPDDFDFRPENVLDGKELEYFLLAIEKKEWPADKKSRLKILLDGLNIEIEVFKEIRKVYRELKQALSL